MISNMIRILERYSKRRPWPSLDLHIRQDNAEATGHWPLIFFPSSSFSYQSEIFVVFLSASINLSVLLSFFNLKSVHLSQEIIKILSSSSLVCLDFQGPFHAWISLVFGNVSIFASFTFLIANIDVNFILVMFIAHNICQIQCLSVVLANHIMVWNGYLWRGEWTYEKFI